MKPLIILAVIIFVLATLSIIAVFLERYWRQHQEERAKATKDSITKRFGINRLTESVSQWTESLRAMVRQENPDEQLAEQFREWVTTDLTEKHALQTWLLALPEEGFSLLTSHIAAFCDELNFNLVWLIGNQEDSAASDLKVTMKAVVVDYCNACQKSISVQDQAHLFAQYYQLLENPNGKQEQALGRTLYANLTAQGLAVVPDASELIHATESERHQHVFKAIQQAAVKDWPQFAQILQDAVTTDTLGSLHQNGHHAGNQNGHHAGNQNDRHTNDHKGHDKLENEGIES